MKNQMNKTFEVLGELRAWALIEYNDHVERTTPGHPYKHVIGEVWNKVINKISDTIHDLTEEVKEASNKKVTWEDFKDAEPEVVIDSLSLCMKEDRLPTLDTVKTWSAHMIGTAMHWALASHLYASDNDDVVVPKRPDFLE